jgi:hypothetical protein
VRAWNLIPPDVGRTKPNNILSVVDFCAVWTKKPVHVASLNTHRQTIDRRAGAKAFSQLFCL